MKKNKKLMIAAIFIFSFLLGASFVLAEDDDNGEDNYQPPVIPAPVATPSPAVITVPSPTVTPPAPTVGPVGIPDVNIISNPVVAQNNLVDSDGDGIIDVLDTHPGEDDFAYAVKDANQNGIADDLEYLLFR